MKINTKKLLGIIIAFAMASGAYAQSLPVLKVTFPGNFSKDMDYIQGQMELTETDGKVVSLPAKFKTRGATAMAYSMKPSFNMKLRDTDGTEIDSTLCDIRSCSSWILDAMAIDRICMRNRVTFDLWNEFSTLSYKTDFDSRNGTKGQFVEVYINNTYKGIYCLSDRINRKLLELKKPQENEDGSITIRGVQYKQGTNSIGDQNTAGVFSPDSLAYVLRWHDAWELCEPEDYAGKAAWQPLIDLYNGFSNYSFVKSHYDIDNIVDYTLLIMTMSISDNWGNKNKYLSIPNITASGNKALAFFTPWDLDTSLGGEYSGKYYNGNYSDWKPSQITSNASGVFATCMQQKEFQNMLKERWGEVRNTVFSISNVAAHLNQYASLFINSGAWQRQWDHFTKEEKYAPCIVEDLQKEVNLVSEWYTKRHIEMDQYFGYNPDDGISSPSVSLSNSAYNLQGQKVSDSYHGLIIKGGKKFTNK